MDHEAESTNSSSCQAVTGSVAPPPADTAQARSESDAKRWLTAYLGRILSTPFTMSDATATTVVTGASVSAFDADAGPFSALAAYCALCADPPPGSNDLTVVVERRFFMPALRRALATHGLTVLKRLDLPAWTSIIVGPLVDAVAERITMEDVLTVIVEAICAQMRDEEDWLYQQRLRMQMQMEVSPEPCACTATDPGECRKRPRGEEA